MTGFAGAAQMQQVVIQPQEVHVDSQVLNQMNNNDLNGDLNEDLNEDFLLEDMNLLSDDLSKKDNVSPFEDHDLDNHFTAVREPVRRPTNVTSLISRYDVVNKNNGIIKESKIGKMDPKVNSPALPFLTPAQGKSKRNPTYLYVSLTDPRLFKSCSITLEIRAKNRSWQRLCDCQIKPVGSNKFVVQPDLKTLDEKYPWLRFRVSCDSYHFILCYLGYANGGESRVVRSNNYLNNLFLTDVPSVVTQALLHKWLN